MTDPSPSYEKVQSCAQNREQYFPFYGLYAMMEEGDGLELLLADDNKIYRVDTADAFLLSAYQLDFAGIDQEFNGQNPGQLIRQSLLANPGPSEFWRDGCEITLNACREKDAAASGRFLEPFGRIQEISPAYIDDVLHTLCYFYPDYIGDYFKRYLGALQKNCAAYWKEKR